VGLGSARFNSAGISGQTTALDSAKLQPEK
jgi:hypothetical protein